MSTNHDAGMFSSPFQRVLGVGAHPDDVELGASGTLTQLVAQGAELTLLTLTNGCRGGASRARHIEAGVAAEVLHAQLIEAGLPDARIRLPDAIAAVEKAVAEAEPDLVLVHDPNDTHQDHRVTFRAVASAARSVPNVLTYESPSTVHFRPTAFNPIDGVLGQKLAVIQAHGSQLARTRMASWATVTALYRHMQWNRQVGFAEAFRAIRLGLPFGGHLAPIEYASDWEYSTALASIAELVPALRALDQSVSPVTCP